MSETVNVGPDIFPKFGEVWRWSIGPSQEPFYWRQMHPEQEVRRYFLEQIRLGNLVLVRES